jgi:hypothetical protein
MSYYVEPNNWTANIPSTITSNDGVFRFPINIDSAYDPAAGCMKDFEAEYRCGRNDGELKSLNVEKEALGKTAIFNCENEYKLCNSLKLVLDNNGELKLLNGENQELWNKFNESQIPESIEVDKYKATNGKTGVNFLKSGEFLGPGEWIGSTNGKYRLIMDGEGSSKHLKVVYNRSACDKNTGPPEDAANLYTIPISNKNKLGSLGFINSEGQLQVYSDDMISEYTSSYTPMGGYNITGNNLNTDVNSSRIATIDECQTKCSEYNENTNSDKCAGFVYKGDEEKCYLKSQETLYGISEKRIINDNYQYYLRTKGINNSDVSCHNRVQDYQFGVTDEWDSFTKGSKMTPTTKCGLANYTEAERNASESKYNTLQNELSTGGVVERINKLDTTYSAIGRRLNNVKKSLKTTFSELTDTRKNLKDWSGDQLKQLNAMNEDRDLNMLSENYRHIMWSILAIVIIIGTIKMTKKSV